MSDIVVSGYYGFGNAGDEAMLAAMIEALTDIEPNVQITVISGNPDDTKRRHGVCAVYRLNYPEIVKALAKNGFADVAQNTLGILKQRISGDYLHTSAILDKDLNVVSAVNNRNDYRGPGTGYRLSKERWDEIKDIRQAIKPSDFDV